MSASVVARIKFYKIKECGYYEKEDNTLLFCKRDAAILGLQQWTAGKEIGLTGAIPAHPDEEKLPVYCYDISFNPKTGGVITTWNCTPVDEKNQTAALNLFAKLGTEEIESSNFSKGYAAGYETYFWFPSRRQDVFASVRLTSRIAVGKDELCRYMQSFLMYHHPKYVFDARDETGCLLYGENAQDADAHLPKFGAYQYRLSGKLDEIRANRSRITTVVRRATLDVARKAVEKDLWQKMLCLYHLSGKDVGREFIDLETRAKFCPDEKQLEQMILDWEKEKDSGLGVIFKGDSNTVHWFDSCLAKGETSINVYKNKHGIFTADSLAQALTEKEDEIFTVCYGKQSF